MPGSHHTRRGAGLAQPVAILCRACGAPYDQDQDAPGSCRYCGSETALDADTRQRMALHVARLQRAVDRAGCALREQIFAQLLPSLLFRTKVYLFGSLAILLVGTPVLIGLGMLPFAMVDRVGPDASIALGLLGVSVIGIGILLAVVVFPVGILLAYRDAVRAELAAATSAREVASHAEVTADARCTQCGGHAQVAIIGRRVAVPCPWCGSNLVAESVDAAKVASDAIILAQQATSDEVLRRVRVRSGLTPRERHRLQIPGLALEGGVYHGAPLGVATWVSFDMHEFGLHTRIEVDRTTRLTGAVWFVRREVAHLHARLLESAGARRPAEVSTDAEIDQRFVVFADAGVSAASIAQRPAVRRLLASLSESESVRFDPAGASEWSITAGSRRTAAARYSAHVEGLVRATLELA